MKKPFLAFILSFFLPGAGLAYLGKWKLGAINLFVVLLIGFILVFVLSEEIFDHYIRFIAMGCSGGSGGLAHVMATQMNQKTKQNEEPQK
jgi:hypothetical protein